MANKVNTLIRAGCLEGFRRMLFSLHVDPSPVLESAGLSSAILDTKDQMIDVRSFRKALNVAAARTGMRDFGLQLSQRQAFEKMGAVAYLARHAPNLETAIDQIIRYFRIHDTGSVLTFEVSGRTALWAHVLLGLGEEPAVQQNELALGITCNFIQSSLSESWTPTAVYFEHSEPADLSPHKAVFRCPIHFDQPINGIEFPASDLKVPLRRADDGLYAVLETYVSSVDERVSTSFAAQVRNIIQENIECGNLKIDVVAELLDLKRHVLQRRLKGEGTTFQGLLDDVRYELGCRYLRDTASPIAEIAAILGYAETAVFTRAFTRRSGVTPNSWRQQNR